MPVDFWRFKTSVAPAHAMPATPRLYTSRSSAARVKECAGGTPRFAFCADCWLRHAAHHCASPRFPLRAATRCARHCRNRLAHGARRRYGESAFLIWSAIPRFDAAMRPERNRRVATQKCLPRRDALRRVTRWFAAA